MGRIRCLQELLCRFFGLKGSLVVSRLNLDESGGFVDHWYFDMNMAVNAGVGSFHDSIDDDGESQATQEEWFLWRELAVLGDEDAEEQQAEDTGSESSDGVEEEFRVEAVRPDFSQQSNRSLECRGQSVEPEDNDLSVRLKRKRSRSLSSVPSSSGDGPQVECGKRFHSDSGLLSFQSSEHIGLRSVLWTEALKESGKLFRVQTVFDNRCLEVVEPRDVVNR